MNYSNNYELNLPSRDGDDIVDVNLLSANFEEIDNVMANNNKLIRANRELIMTSHKTIESHTEELEAQAALLDKVRRKAITNSSNIAEMRIEIGDLQSAVQFMKIAEALPETAYENTIYFVPKAEPQENNRYDKFVYLNIGTTDAPEFVWEKL